MSDFIHFEYENINTVSPTIAKDYIGNKEINRSGSLLNDNDHINYSEAGNDNDQSYRGSINRTAFDKRKTQNKYEVLRKQSSNTVRALVNNIDKDVRTTLCWNTEGPSIEVI